MADYIDRETVLDIVKRTSGDYATAFSEIVRVPSADVAPVVHASWKLINKGYGQYICTNCGGIDEDSSDYYGTHCVTEQEYCPMCGAKMDGGDACVGG